MAEHTVLLGPEPDNHQVLVLPGGEVDEAIHPPPDASNPPVPKVLGEELRGVTGFGRLGGCEVALPSGRKLV